MIVKTFAWATLVATATIGCATAAPLPADPSFTASIFSRNAYSRFERNSFVTGLNISDDGYQTESTSTLPEQIKTFALPAGGSDGPSGSLSSRIALLQRHIDTAPPGDETSFGSGDTLIVPSTNVGAVPLPRSLPLFGSGLLALSAFGFTRRRGALRKG